MKKKICLALALALLMIVQRTPAPALGQTQFTTYHWHGPYVSEVDIIEYASSQAQTLALEKGDVDMAIGIPYSMMTDVLANPDLKIMTMPSVQFVYIPVNLRRPPLNDVNFRRALMYLIDRQKIVSDVEHGFAYIDSTGMLPFTYGEYKNTNITDPYTFNPSMAASILDAAGYKMDNATHIRINPATGKDIQQLQFMYVSSSTLGIWLASNWVPAAQSIGIPLVGDPVAYDLDINNLFAKYDFDFALTSWTWADTPDFFYDILYSGQAPDQHNMAPWWYNTVDFDNATYDYWALRLKYAPSLEEAKQASWETQLILSQQLPYLPLYVPVFTVGVNTANWEGYVDRPGRIESLEWWSLYNVRPTPNSTATNSTVFKVAMVGDVPNLNVFDATELNELTVTNEFYDCLTQPDPFNPLTLKPWLAASWNTTTWQYAPGKNGTVLTWNLFHNITWSDGVPFTSADVKWTYLAYRDDESAAWLSYGMDHIVNIDTPDPYTVTIYYNGTSPWYTYWQTSQSEPPILPEHIWSNITKGFDVHSWEPADYGKEIGTGPFELLQWSKGNFFRLVPNPYFFERPLAPVNSTSSSMSSSTSSSMSSSTSSVLVGGIAGLVIICAAAFVALRKRRKSGKAPS